MSRAVFSSPRILFFSILTVRAIEQTPAACTKDPRGSPLLGGVTFWPRGASRHVCRTASQSRTRRRGELSSESRSRRGPDRVALHNGRTWKLVQGRGS